MNPTDIDLSKPVSINISLGHLLFVWETMSAKLSTLNDRDDMSEDEKRAVWGLIDLMEPPLAESGLGTYSHAEWETLLARAAEVVRMTPVDFLD